MKIDYIYVMKIKALLPIDYKIKEISNETGATDRQVRYWISECGAPTRRDSRKHIWISGKELIVWIEERTKKKSRKKLQDHEAYCFKCKQVVELIDPIMVPIKGKLVNYRGDCQYCGTRINRGGRLDG